MEQFGLLAVVVVFLLLLPFLISENFTRSGRTDIRHRGVCVCVGYSSKKQQIYRFPSREDFKNPTNSYEGFTHAAVRVEVAQWRIGRGVPSGSSYCAVYAGQSNYLDIVARSL